MHGLRSIFVGVVEFMAFHHIWMIILLAKDLSLTVCCLLRTLTPNWIHLHKTERHKTMEICVESFDGEKYTVEVGVDDTTADIRRKVASAAELCEDGFDMSFGGKLLAEGDYITQLSAGDTVVLTKKTLVKTKSQKDDAIAALRDLGETRLTRERFKGPDGGPPPIAHFCGARAYGISIFFSREPKSGQVLDKYVVLLDLQTVWGGGTSGRRVLPGTPISYHKELESCMECRVL